MVSALLAAPRVAAAESFDGETFASEPTFLGETGLDGCSGDPAGGAQEVRFKAAGRATGPYPGVFVEQGKATTAGGRLVSFEATFKVYPDTSGYSIEGSKSFDASSSGTALCIFPGPATGDIRGHDIAYSVGIVRPDGSADRYDGTSQLEFEQEGGLSGTFTETFGGVPGGPPPPPPPPPPPAPPTASGMPVIFVHGFLGARLGCDERGARNGGVSQFYGELWPGSHLVPSSLSLVGGDPLTWLFLSLFGPPQIKLPIPQLGWLQDMALRADGRTDAPGTWCAGKVDALGLVRDVKIGPISQDIYGEGFDHLGLSGPTYDYVYDWRKSPELAIAGLDQRVEQVRRETGADKVAIMAHSMGGLVSRWYIDDPARAGKVARLLTVGTPYWGSPKAWLPLAHGQQSPSATDFLDPLLDNAELRVMARNLTGLYYLLPSAQYIDAIGGWLKRGAAPYFGVAGTLGMIRALPRPGGNAALAREALDAHSDVFDGFKTNGVDYRVLVGAGLETLERVKERVGLFTLFPAEYEYASGDGTVPLISAQQGADPNSPLGEHVPISRICNVEHTDLTDVAYMQRAVPFLRAGHAIPSDGSCPANGTQVVVAAPGSKAGLCRSARRGTDCGLRARIAGAGSVSLREAVASGVVDIIESGPRTVMVVQGSTPVTMALSAPRGTVIEATPLVGEATGRPRAFGPLRGSIVLTVGSGGTRLTRHDREVKSRAADRKPPVTTVTKRRSGRFVILTPRARDASGVLATMIRMGHAKPRRWTKRLRVRARRARRVSYASVDVFGNQERRRTLRVARAG